MGTLIQDLRYGLHQLRRSPGFTVVAVLTLALGIGANTAIFSVVNSVLLRPLPYPQPNRLVKLLWGWPQGWAPSVSALEFKYWKEHSQVLDSAAAYQTGLLGLGFNLSVGPEPDYVKGGYVSQEFFRVLGATPFLGRDFLPADDQPGSPRVAILSHRLWTRRFGADRDVLGRTIHLDGRTYTVIGVLSADFTFVEAPATDVWLPLQLVADPRSGAHDYGAIARLNEGVTLEQARADLAQILPQFRREFPDHTSPKERGVLPVSYGSWLSGDVRTPLLVLFAAVGLVLMIAAANVANLLLARTAAREREIAIRLTLGAGRGRLFQQFLTESLVLSLFGGVAGLLLAPWTLRLVLSVTPQELPLVGPIRLDLLGLVFALGLATLVGVAIGVIPLLRVSSLNPNDALKEGGRTPSMSLGRQPLRSMLIVAEMAISLVLLVNATLLIYSLYALWTVKVGFDSRGVWTFRMKMPPEKYRTTGQVWDFERQILERLKVLPGVTSAATASSLPLEWGLNFGVTVLDGEKKDVYIQSRAISPQYFKTMGIPILQGRAFLDADTATAPPVVIVNEAFVRACCQGQEVIGRRVQFQGGTEEVLGKQPGWQIVGTVGDVHETNLAEPASPTVFWPQSQVPDSVSIYNNRYFLAAWILRSEVPLRLRDVQRIVTELDSGQPVVNLQPMTDIVRTSVTPQCFTALLMGTFAGLALVLAAVGLYGVISYSVAQRTHEIGVRMALGAEPGDVLALVTGQGLRLALIGVGIGLAAALVLTRFLRSMLYSIRPADPMVLAVVTLVLAAVALLASYIPARRATKVDPMVALRYE